MLTRIKLPVNSQPLRKRATYLEATLCAVENTDELKSMDAGRPKSGMMRLQFPNIMRPSPSRLSLYN
ncbi:MAG TPA: hypothetical protein VLT51_12255 [Anaerolineales bacterium]|nr:hypothetical protein [Anaerolineales bacterium]